MFPFTRMLVLVILLTGIPQAQSADSVESWASIAGSWSGELNVGPQVLRMRLEIEAGPSGASGALISVDQGGARIALDTLELDGDTLSFSASTPRLSYRGDIEGDLIEGVFRQAGQQFPLNFERGAPAAKELEDHPRDQSVRIESSGASLAGSFRSPRTVRNGAGLVILSGSGAQDRDGTMYGQALYRALADTLDAAGIASLRLDDRGIGQSQGDLAASPAALAEDAAAALSWLRDREGVTCAGFLGHSEGALIALLAAGESDPDFIISLAGMHAPLEDVLFEQAEAIIAASGGTREQIEQNRELQEAVFAAMAAAEGPAAVDEITQALLDAGLPRERAIEQGQTWGQPYAVALLGLDPPALARRYPGAMLAFFAGNDLQVPPESFAPRLASQREGLPTRIRVIEGVDHLFQESQTGLPGDYGSAGHPLAPAAAEALAEGIGQLADQHCEP